MEAMRKQDGVMQYLVHTGQHYDAQLSKIFFEELQFRGPTQILILGREAMPNRQAG